MKGKINQKERDEVLITQSITHLDPLLFFLYCLLSNANISRWIHSLSSKLLLIFLFNFISAVG
jgi:hypothetical protein